MMGLLIDDHPFALHLLGRQLTAFGVREIQRCADGKSALEAIDTDANANARDALVADLNMSRSAGSEFLRHLAKRRFSGRVGLISGKDERIPQSALDLQLNAAGWLKEPVVLSRPDATPRGARELRVRSVARGIEGRDDWNGVHAPQCDIGQRRLGARPMPTADSYDGIAPRDVGRRVSLEHAW